jgi:hypothetical protein
MRRVTYLLVLLTSLVTCLVVFASGCSGSEQETLQNSRSWSLDGISVVTVSYPLDNITFVDSTSDTLTVKEYMTTSDESYFANLSQDGDALSITSGARPSAGSTFSSHVEIFLPLSYEGALNIETTSGNVSFSPTFNLTSLKVNTTSGNITLPKLYASSMALSTSSGHISLAEGHGAVVATTQTGSIELKNMRGAITAKTDSGNVTVDTTGLVGDISLTTNTGKINLTLPSNSAFSFEATAPPNTMRTDFETTQDEPSASSTPVTPTPTATTPTGTDGSTPSRFQATVGDNPTHRISIDSKSGTVTVKFTS